MRIFLCNQSVCLSVCVSVCVCLSASISLEPLDRSARSARTFVCRSPVAVAQSYSGGVALRYVLPVLWMMSRLARRRKGVGSTQHWRSITCATGAESDVYEHGRRSIRDREDTSPPPKFGLGETPIASSPQSSAMFFELLDEFCHFTTIILIA